MAIQNIIGEQLRRIRNSMGLTQNGLAVRCNLRGWDVSRATVSKIEAGIRRVTDAELFLIADALHIDVNRLRPEKKAAIVDCLRQGRCE